MKKLVYILLLLVSTVAFSQSNPITYQAVIYLPSGQNAPGVNVSNVPMTNKNICLQFSFFDANNRVEYQEEIKVKTDEFGMVNITIGNGEQSGGYASSFDAIVWNASVQKNLQVALDARGLCNQFEILSNEPIASVPFANAAITAGNVSGVVALANGGTGAITASAARTNLGIGNVDNTSDLNKPLSTATKTYVDTAITGATIVDADAATKGKIQLAGDLAGTAAAPTVPGLALKEDASNKSTTTTLGTSDSLYPSQKAVKTYVDTAIAGATIVDADAATKGKIQLAGDLAGTAAAPTVPGLALKEDASNKSTTTTLGTSDSLYPSQKAVKTYVDTAIAGATIVDADAATKGKIQLAGDLAGTAAAPTVPGLALKEDASNKSTTTTLGTSDSLYPSQKAVKTYVDTAIAGATIVDADAATKGKIQLAGDLAGTAAAPTVPGLALKEDASNKSTTTTLGTSNVLFPTQNAVKTYVDTAIAGATIVDADATTKGKIQLAGDLAGTAASPTVPGLALKEDASNKSTTTTLGTSDSLYPTQKAVKTYADAKVVDGIADTVTTSAPTQNAVFDALALKANATDMTTSLGLKANTADVTTSLALKEDAANKTVSVTTDGASDEKFPSAKAVKTYADAKVVDGIADTITTSAPTQNAVFDALASKANATDMTTSLGLKANTADVTTSLALKEDAANKTVSVTTDGASDEKFPSAKAVKTYADAKVVDGITDAETTTAPSQNAVFDALALKANATDVTTSLALKANTTDVTSSLTLKEDAANKTLSVTTDGASDVKFPSAKAVKTYVDTAVSGSTTSVPYTGALSAVNLGAYDLTVNGVKVGLGAGQDTSNTVLGNSALNNNTTGVSSVAVGYAALKSSTTANSNTAIGNGAMEATTSGGGNVAIGMSAMSKNTIGQQNTAIGQSALYNNTDASANTVIGNSAGASITTGGYNTIIGTDAAGGLSTGSSNTIIGRNVYSGEVSNNIIIGNGQGQIKAQHDGTSWTLGTIGSGVWNGTEIAITKGGTGATSAAAALTNLGAEPTANKSTATDLGNSAPSDVLFPSQKAVKAYVDSSVSSGAPDATTTTAGKIKLAGDLSGTAALPTVAAGAISEAKLAADAVTSAKIKDGEIVNADVSTTAAIAYSKLNLASSIVAADIATDAIETAKIKNAAVETAKLADGSVTTVKLATDAVTTLKITDANVTAAKLASDAVETAKIKDLNVTTGKLAADAVTSAKIKDGEIVNADVSSTAAIAYSKLDLASSIVAADIATDAIETAKIKNAAVETAKLADGSVTTVKLATDAVTTLKITDANVTAAKLASDAVETAKIKDLNVTTGKLAADAVTSAKIKDGEIVNADVSSTAAIAYSKLDLASSIVAADIATDAIETAKIKNAAVETAKLADGSVTTVKLATDAVTTLKITDANVTAAKLASDAVETAKIKDLNVTTGKLAADAVTSAKITDGTIVVGDLADNAVESAKIKAAAVTNAKLDKSNIPLSGFGAAAADVALGANKLTGVADPTLAQDAATKNYVDTATAGITTLADGKIYLGNASNVATEVTPSGDVTMTNAGVTAIGTGKVVVGMLATDAVETIKIKDANVTTAKLADAAVTTAKITDANITTAKLADTAVTTAKITDANVTYAKIQNVSATDKVLGRVTAGAGVVEEIATTGSGNVVRATSPTLVTPTLGAATATTINKVTITQPTASATLTIADGKTLTANNSIVLAGTDDKTMTFPTTDATIARTDAAQTFTGIQTFSSDMVVNSINIGRGKGAIATNTAVGTDAISATATGTENAALGYNALKVVTSGSRNAVVGSQAAKALITGIDNIALGYRALSTATSSESNTAIGSDALKVLGDSTNDRNTAVGTGSFSNLTTGQYNVAVGQGTFLNATSGSNNVGVGKYAGFRDTNDAGVTSSNKSVFIGAETKPLNSTSTNEIVIGYDARGLGNNSTVLGNSLITQAKVFGALDLPDATTSTSTTTGALKVGGGVGIVENLNVGGNAKITGTLTVTNGAGAGKVLTSDANGLGTWTTPTGVTTMAAIGSTPNANGATISGVNLNLEPASASYGGIVTTGTQTFAGAKTFSPALTAASALAIGTKFTPTLTAAANADILVGLDIDPTFTNGSYSALTNYALRVQGIGFGRGGGAVETNTAIGSGTLINNTTGANNTGLGYRALLLNSTGSGNTAFGTLAGAYIGPTNSSANSSGTNSTFIGYNTSPLANGDDNEVVIAGGNATTRTVGLGSNTTLIGNAATTQTRIMGALDLPDATASTSSTSGALKVAGGAGIAGALNVGTTATITGATTISSTTSSTSTTTGALKVAGGAGIAGNTYIGGTISIAGGSPGAGKVLTSDANGVGSWATPAGVTSIGTISGSSTANGASITTGVLNLAPADGTNGGVVTTTTQTFAGAKTFSSNIVSNGVKLGKVGGSNNVLVGSNAMNTTTTTSDYNTAIGAYTLTSITSGLDNIALGYSSLYNLTTGSDNVAIGSAALNTHTSGSYNVAVGNNALKSSTTSTKNVSLGYWSSYKLTTGSGNTTLGYYAGSYIGSSGTVANTTGSNSTFIGINTSPLADGDDNEVVIAGGSTYRTVGLGSNSTLIGNAATTQTRIMGALDLPDATASTSSTSGALKVAGGAGIAGALNVGTTATITGATSLSSTLGVTGNVAVNTDKFKITASNGNTEIAGTIKIAGGSPGLGKVLTSDANGLATWSNNGGGVLSKTATYTILTTDNANVLVFSGSTASQTITLPSAVTVGAGREITIKNVASVSIAIASAGGYLISDSTTTTATGLNIGIEPSNNWIKAISDGANWIILRALF